MKRIANRKIRNFLNRWLKIERGQQYTTAFCGKADRLRMFKRTLGF